MQAAELIPVRVLVRCRPLVEKEVIEGCSARVSFYEEYQQVSLPDLEKSFTFDYVFPPLSTQDQVYEKCSPDLLNALFSGYNATILAYGQTGSGKTFTMGTAYSKDGNSSNMGIIPRVISDIFQRLKESSELCYNLKVSFLEIYNEDIYDLLSATRECVAVREDNNGIKVAGMQEIEVKTEDDVLEQLTKGSASRKTGSTNMNKVSSRSHALFTISVQLITNSSNTTSKFQLVDLAGSEKAKKTGAEGDRFKEGVNINRGLFALGNVISALCDKNSHIPYRDSRLTRLLQDSLGGNSHTAMIACISPADSNLEETLNTLRYADRARKIKNRPIINLGPEEKELAEMRQKYQLLESVWKEHMQTCPQKNCKASKTPDPVPTRSVASETSEEKQHPATVSSSSSTITATRKIKSSSSRVTEDKTVKSEHSDIEKEMESLISTNRQLILNWTDSQNAANSYLKRIEEMEEVLKDWKQRFDSLATEIKKMDGRTHENGTGQAAELLNNVRKFSEAIEYYEAAELNLKPVTKVNSDELSEIQDCLKTLDENLNEKQQELLKSQAHSQELEPLKKIAENQQVQIETLEKEKSELEAYLKSHPSARISEDRRKKITELEKQVLLLKKQLEMNTKALKTKEVAERKVKALNNEIMALKKSKVTMQKRQELIQRQVREEKLKAAQQAAQASRKVNSLIFTNQKLECRKHVLEQKLREADASKRKLEAVLARKEAAKANSTKAGAKAKSPGSPKNPQKIYDFLDAELEFTVRSDDLCQHLEELKTERKALATKLVQLTKELEDIQMEPPVKKSLSGDENFGFQDVDVKKRDLTESIKFIQESLRVRSDQITKLLKQTILFDQEEQKQNIRKFFECQEDREVAMLYLFQKSVQEYKQVTKCNAEVEAAKGKLAEQENKAARLERSLRKLEERHTAERLEDKQLNQTRLSMLEKEHRSKLLEYLRDASSISLYSIQETQDPKLLETLQKQATDINNLNDIQDELKKKTEECELLQKEISVLQQQKRSSKRQSFFSGCDLSSMPSFSLNPKPLSKPKKSSAKSSKIPSLAEYEEDMLESEGDDNTKDPDWTKTPLQKGRRTTRGPMQRVGMKFSDSDSDTDVDASKEKKPLKQRNSSSSCQCGNLACKNNRCSCRKSGSICTPMCKCSPSICRNQKQAEDDEKYSEMNTTFLDSDTQPLTGIENIIKDENQATEGARTTFSKKLYSAQKSTLFLDPS